MFQHNESIIDRKTCLINNSLNMETINNQLFNNNNNHNHNYTSSSMRIDKSDKLPSINDCKLSIPKLYKAKITPDWIVTICSEIWTRLLSSSSPSSSSFILDSNENNIDHQISGSKLVNYLMITENKTDRNLICGLWQLLLDENAIEPILSLNNNNDNNDKSVNSVEFYDRDDVFYICKCIKNKRLSIDEALIINEISLNNNQSNLEQNHDLLKLINNTSNDPMTQINLHNNNNISNDKSNQYINIINDHNHEIDGYHILIDKLYRLSPEALFRKILQKLPSNRTENELQYVYQELLLVPALSSFSISVKQELCKCLYYEVHENALDIVFYQGDPGISWYIIYHGSVWVHINNQGYICLLNEGDDFGKLSLITDKPRAASILLAENNCHFLKLNKNDFNRILCNVEANTVHLKNNNSDVLILERIPDNKLLIQLQNNQLHNHSHHQINDNDNQLINKLTDHNYSIIAGTIEYILYHLLENCLNELNNQLQSIINNQLYPSYLYPHTPYNIDQTWQIFFLTYKLFTTNNEILLFLYKYLATSSEHGDSSVTATTTTTTTTTTSTTSTTANYVKSLDNQDTTIVHNEQYNPEMKSIPNLLFDLHISPNTLPLIQSIHTVTIKIYITELTKQIYMTVPIEANVYEIKQLLITNQMIQSNINELKLVEVFSKGDWIIYQDYECGIMFSLSSNSRLFLTKESQIQNLIPLAEQLIVTMNFLELNDIDRIKNFNQHDHLLLRKNRLMQTSIRLLDELTIDELATILSYCHVQLAICIHPQELLDYVIDNNNHNKANKPCSHIRTLVKRFSLLHAWTITQIVTTCNLTKRVNIIKKLIKLANCLLSSPLYDLYSSFAIILGLQNSSITRLTHTWERVPNRWRRLFNDTLLPLTDPSKNHRTARLWNNYNENNNYIMHNIINLPRLPFLPLILKDLRFAEDANQTDYHKTDNNNNNNNNNNRLINFNKMRLISTSLRSWINCISGYELLHPYNQFIDLNNNNNNKINNSLINNITVQKLLEVTNESKIFVLEHLHCIDDPKIITQLSLRLEPKK
uniref:Rap guanine nucleotide exchange factor 4 n=1 Tax=Schistosoma haematobium TaxID=6185 RepID=A0A095BT33_SCHHA